MKNTAAIATSAGMVALAVATCGVLIFSSQAASSPITPVPAPPAGVVVEYVGADGTLLPVQAAGAPLAVLPASDPMAGDELAGYDEDPRRLIRLGLAFRPRPRPD